MSINFGTALIQIDNRWTSFLPTVISKSLAMQYYDDGSTYTIFAVDGVIAYNTSISKGTTPSPADYSQAQNDADKADFEANYKSRSNLPHDPENFASFQDPRIIRVFGNLTTGSTSEVLVSIRPYTEPGSQAQRSVVSTNVNDINPSGTGAKQVRITYLNSNYVQNIEDVLMSGTTAVNTVNTDIRFIQKFEVIKGSAAVGAIKLMSAITGSGTEVCGIGAAGLSAFLCHYYVPSGSYVYPIRWGATVDDDVSLKFTGQQWNSGNLIDTNIDIQKMASNSGPITSPGEADFVRTINGVRLDPKTYLRITCVPSQSTNTTIRSFIEIWQTIGPIG